MKAPSPPIELAGIALLVASAAACASGPSPRWQNGGGPIPVEAAYFTRKATTVELRPTGEVIEDDTLLFRIDRAGRVSDDRGKPVAVLLADGWLVSERDDAVLAWIGPGTSLQADRRTQSVRLLSTGEAIIGESVAGRWDYCTGAMLRTCTLVTHVIAARERASTHDGPRDALSLIELLTLVR